MMWNETTWREQLKKEFAVDGVVGGSLIRVLEAEARCRAEAENRYQNFAYIFDSFLFFTRSPSAHRLRQQRLS